MRGGYQTQADAARRIAGFVLLLTGVSLNPARLQSLASDHLNLAPTQTSQMIDVADISARFPLKQDVKDDAVVIENSSGGAP